MRIIVSLCLLALFASCTQDKNQKVSQRIIDKAIENAGGKKYDAAKIEFTFRGIKYSSRRENGEFELSRTMADSLGEIKDILTNTGFARFANGVKIEVPDSMATKYTNSVNAVHYFVQLPYGLNSPAVHKEWLGEAQIGGKMYDEIKVTFAEEGGGVDHEDVYMYWVSKDDTTVDYLAYKFYTDNGGIRFRKAYNARMVNGIRFVDYENYKVEPWESVDMQKVDELFEAGKLELLSKVVTEDVKVSFL